MVDRADRMQYQILGDVAEGEEEKLSRFTGVVPWTYLRPHFQSGVLYYVDASLKLAEVGEHFVKNGVEDVEALLRSGDLVKIGELHAEQWEKSDVQFEALVVSPFVLCRPAAGEI